MDFIKLLPRWLLVAAVGYIAALLSYATYDNRAISFWPPKIEAKATAAPASASASASASSSTSSVECVGYKRFAGQVFDDPVRNTMTEWNFIDRTFLIYKESSARKGSLLAVCFGDALFMRTTGAADDSTCLWHGTILPAGDISGQGFCSSRNSSKSLRIVRFAGNATK